MNTSTPTPEENREESDVGGVALVTMVDLNSLTLPLFKSDDGLKANNPLYQMDKLTPSAPILMSQSSASIPIPAKVSAALVITGRNYWHKKRVDELSEKLRTTPHCRKCPFPSCAINKIGFHNVNSSYPLRNHMESYHRDRTDHNGSSLCPVRTCEYSVLGFETLDMCMRHLSMHHGIHLCYSMSL